MSAERVEELVEYSNIIYRFNLLLSEYSKVNMDYGTGDLVSMVEVHTLSYINKNAGITVTELSEQWNKTKGAVSQIVTKLENKGLVEKKKNDGNNKNVLLFVTEKGENLCNHHFLYDARKMMWLLDELSKCCSSGDFESFIKVTKRWSEILEEKNI